MAIRLWNTLIQRKEYMKSDTRLSRYITWAFSNERSKHDILYKNRNWFVSCRLEPFVFLVVGETANAESGMENQLQVGTA